MLREVLPQSSAIADNVAHLDVVMYGLWGGRFEKAYVNIQVFNNAYAQSNRCSLLVSVYRRHEQGKKRHYEQHV